MWIKFENDNEAFLLNMDNVEAIIREDKTVSIQFILSGENDLTFDTIEEAKDVLIAFERCLKGLNFDKRYGDKTISLTPFRGMS